MAEFMGNNQASETTGMSPFFTNYRFNPRMDFLESEDGENEDLDAAAFTKAMTELHEHLRSEIGYAQARQQEYADEHRLPAPSFQVGDKVWLNAKNIRTRRPCRKLDSRCLGPYTVTKQIGTHAYRLCLPDSIRIHNVFHVSLLDMAADDPLPGQQTLPPPSVEVEGEQE